MNVIIDTEKCTGCLQCIVCCPREALSWKNGKVECDKELCTGCRVCIEACVVDAIMEEGDDGVGFK